MKKYMNMKKHKILYWKYKSSISQFLNNLYSWTYCSYTLHILFHSEIKITLFYLHLFSFIHFHSLYHSFSFVVIRCHLLSFAVTLCHSLSPVATRCTSYFHSLSFVIPLVIIRCYSLSFVVTRFTTSCHLFSLDVPLVCLFINDLTFI